MANEINVTINANITISGQTAGGITSFSTDLLGDFIGEEQQIGTTAEVLDLGDVTSVRILYVRNMDSTNYVEVDFASAINGFPQKVLPGAAILLMPQTITVYARAHTAPVKIYVVAG